MTTLRDRFRGALLGLAAGDAVGTTLEFTRRDSAPPVEDMVGGGPFGLRAGQWTDDTSMALCLATSLVEQRGFDPLDQMERYVRWASTGYLSSNGECFDMGNTVRRALATFRSTGDPVAGPTEADTAGNGSIMRLCPVAMFFHPARPEAVRYAAESSRTTHGATECVEACELMATLLVRAFDGASKEELFQPVEEGFSSSSLEAMAAMRFRDKNRGEIRSSGYVVHTLEAALWCLWHADTIEDAILRAANLGEDADTTGAVCGQLAGAHYGATAIPEGWLRKLAMREHIVALADALGATTPPAAEST